MQENITVRHVERPRMCVADTYKSGPFVWRPWWKSFRGVFEMNYLFRRSEGDVVVDSAHHWVVGHVQQLQGSCSLFTGYRREQKFETLLYACTGSSQLSCRQLAARRCGAISILTLRQSSNRVPGRTGITNHHDNSNITWQAWHFSLFCKNLNAIRSSEKSLNMLAGDAYKIIYLDDSAAGFFIWGVSIIAIRKYIIFTRNLRLHISTSRIMPRRSLGVLKKLESMPYMNQHVLLSIKSKRGFHYQSQYQLEKGKRILARD